MTSPSKDLSGPGARLALAILTLVNLFNYLDRYVLAALVESVRAELSLSDAQLGFLMSGFILVYMLASPAFGILGDRRGRPPLLAFGVGLWSAATFLSGLARSFGALLAARASVGIGEAAYGTIAPALLADSFPERVRGRVFAIFFAAIPIGSAAGYILGGLVDQRFGWRAAFFAAGAPGLLLALLCLKLDDPPRGARDRAPAHPAASPAGERKGAWRTYLDILRNRQYVLTVGGYAAYTFALGAVAFWMPAFLERVRGMSRAQATVQFGTIVVATGFAGTFAGGWLGDVCLRRWRQAYLWVSGWTALAAAPAALLAFEARDARLATAGIVAAELLLFASTGPINSAIVALVAPTERASAVALSILVIHLFGDVPSPPLIGAISDAASLPVAFRILPLAIAASGGVWLYAAWRGERGERAA